MDCFVIKRGKVRARNGSLLNLTSNEEEGRGGAK